MIADDIRLPDNAREADDLSQEEARFRAALVAFQDYDCDLLDDDEIIRRVLAAADGVCPPCTLSQDDKRLLLIVAGLFDEVENPSLVRSKRWLMERAGEQN